jgi:hypothetical protein
MNGIQQTKKYIELLNKRFKKYDDLERDMNNWINIMKADDLIDTFMSSFWEYSSPSLAKVQLVIKIVANYWERGFEVEFVESPKHINPIAKSKNFQ